MTMPIEIDMGRICCQNCVDHPMVIIQRRICRQVTAQFAFKQMACRAVRFPANFGLHSSNDCWQLCNGLIPLHANILA
jgi:hypothetical protein